MLVTHLQILGRVQGVGYRSWFMHQARLLGLRGWVRNRSDGSVEALVAGDAQAVSSIFGLAHEGPAWARVDSVEREISQEAPGDDFRIERTI
ncbi:MAG: acylphosphatase [Geminicoccaceae bacterium]